MTDSDITNSPLCWILFFNGSVQAIDLGLTLRAAVIRDSEDIVKDHFDDNRANKRDHAGNIWMRNYQVT